MNEAQFQFAYDGYYSIRRFHHSPTARVAIFILLNNRLIEEYTIPLLLYDNHRMESVASCRGQWRREWASKKINKAASYVKVDFMYSNSWRYFTV
jgi:hypothetical protein